MGTIDYESHGQKIQFSRKSVTINGNEFAYTGITAIKHSSSKHIYLFKCDNDWQRLYYNEEDAQKLKTLFSRISSLNAKRAESRAKAETAAAETIAPDAADTAKATAGNAASVEEQVDLFATHHSLDIKDALETALANDRKANLDDSSEELPASREPVAKSEPEAAENTGAATADSEINAAAATDKDVDEVSSTSVDSAAKKKKLKKALLIFAAFIVLWTVLGIACYFLFSTSVNPGDGINTTESQQYNDIDGLIKDLQK